MDIDINFHVNSSRIECIISYYTRGGGYFWEIPHLEGGGIASRFCPKKNKSTWVLLDLPVYTYFDIILHFLRLSGLYFNKYNL